MTELLAIDIREYTGVLNLSDISGKIDLIIVTVLLLATEIARIIPTEVIIDSNNI
jgi:hypothetical protein